MKRVRSKEEPKRITAADKFIGNRLRQARMVAGLSQTKAADALGLTFQQIQKYEKGINRIAPGRLMTLALLFGKEIGWFFAGIPLKDVEAGAARPDPMTTFGNNMEDLHLARAFPRLPAEIRRTFVSMAEMVLDAIEAGQGFPATRHALDGLEQLSRRRVRVPIEA